MKKIKTIILCLSTITSMAFSVTVSAYDANMDDEWMGVCSEFDLTGGKAGERVEALSNGTIKREFSSLQEMEQAASYVVTLSGSMDGEEESSFYWSGNPYQNGKGEMKHIAVLQADEAHPWSEKTCMVFKVMDFYGSITGIEAEMGSSEEGPRDYKISYSTDWGKTWNEFTTYGTDRGSVTAAGCTSEVFKKSTADIKRNYKTVSIKGYNGGYIDVRLYDDIYFKVSVDSDYKVDGTEGLYGSTAGEWGIRSVKLLVDGPETGDTVMAPSSFQAYKTAENAATLTWRKSDSASGYEVYLKKGNKSYQKVQTITSSQSTKCTINNLSPTAVYKLRIRAYLDKRGERTYSGFTKSVTINMKKQPLLKNLSVKKDISMKVGQKKNLAVKCTRGTSSRYIKNVNYKVKNTKVASVKLSGIISGKKKGDTIIKIKVTLKNGQKKTFITKVKII